MICLVATTKTNNSLFIGKDINIAFNGELKRTTDKYYRQLKVLIERMDPPSENTGLTKVEGGSDGREKSIEWICELYKEGFQVEGINYTYTPVSGAEA